MSMEVSPVEHTASVRYFGEWHAIYADTNGDVFCLKCHKNHAIIVGFVIGYARALHIPYVLKEQKSVRFDRKLSVASAYVAELNREFGGAIYTVDDQKITTTLEEVSRSLSESDELGTDKKDCVANRM